jgi:hypothetical protein
MGPCQQRHEGPLEVESVKAALDQQPADVRRRIAGGS